MNTFIILLSISAGIIIALMVATIILRKQLHETRFDLEVANNLFYILRDQFEEVDKERDKLADIVCGDIPKTMGDLAQIIHEQAVAHGWWDDERSFPEIVVLCHYELSKALEEYGNAKPAQYVVIETVGEKPVIETDPQGFGERKPEGIAVEMADCIIRILDWCGKNGIDIDDVVERKMAYNATRPYKHGGKVC